MKHHSPLRGKALAFLLFLWFLWFLNFTMRSLFAPLLPLIEDEFVISHARSSSIFLVLAAGYALSMFLSGLYAGRAGYKRTILFSLYVAAFSASAVVFTKAFLLLYPIAFTLGFSIGLYLPSAMPVITEYIREKDWGKAIAIHDSGASIAIFTTPLVALFLLTFLSWRGAFGAFAGICLVCAAVLHLAGDEIRILHTQDAPFRRIITGRSFWVAALVMVSAAGANIGVYLIAPLYLTKELSLAIGWANTILGVSRLGAVAAAVAAGVFVDRISLRKMMCAMLIVAGVLTVVTGVAPARWMGPVLFLQAFFVTGFFPLCLVSIAKMFGRETRGMATGLVMALSVIVGGGFVPYLLGLAGDLLSFRSGITVLGVLVLLSSGFVLTLRELD